MSLNVNIRTSECAWAHFEVKILGRTIRGIRGFSFKRSTEKEHLYGAGQNPLDIQEGNIKCEGNIKILGFELDAMTRAVQLAGYISLDEVPHELIVITGMFQKTKADPKKQITVTGVAFTEIDQAMEQNAKYMEVTLPFIAMEAVTTIL